MKRQRESLNTTRYNHGKMCRGVSFKEPGNLEATAVIDFPEQSPWDSGFSIFKRRIGEQLQLNGFSYDSIDDSDLLNFYRRGESETFVLSAAGCF